MPGSRRQNGQPQQLSGPLQAEVRRLLTSPQSPGQRQAPRHWEGSQAPAIPCSRLQLGSREEVSRAVCWLRWVNARGRQPGLGTPRVAAASGWGLRISGREGARDQLCQLGVLRKTQSRSSGCRTDIHFSVFGDCGSEVPALGDGAPGRSGPSAAFTTSSPEGGLRHLLCFSKGTHPA